MIYKHGIYIEENPTRLTTPVESLSAVQFVVGTAPINMAEVPADAFNVPIKTINFDDAKAKIGYSDDWDNYTVCQSSYASYAAYAVNPVVFLNVLDPVTHKTAVVDAAVSVTNLVANIAVEGILKAGMVVKSEDGLTTYVLDTDYTLAFADDGTMNITLLSTGSATAETALTVDYDKLDPSAITETEIIAGIKKVQEMYVTTDLYPGLILAPGWSHKKAVGQEILANNIRIGGLFNTSSLLDLDTATVTTYAGVKAEKDTNKYTTKNSIVCWPKVKYNGKEFYMSAMVGAHIGAVDVANDGVPYVSPSNKKLFCDALVLEGGTEVKLQFTEANAVNADGVCTGLFMNSMFKFWGNNTGAYPETTDPKDRFIPVRRMFDWWGNTFILTYFDRVDDPLNVKLIESVVDDENIRVNGFKAANQIIDARFEFRIADNSAEDLAQGQIVFRQYLTPAVPTESITNILEFDPSALTAQLS